VNCLLLIDKARAKDNTRWKEKEKKKKSGPGFDNEMHCTLRPHASMCGTRVGRVGLSQRALALEEGDTGN
jgi:hypothetical protein